jgi:hypothetical protein
MDLRDAFSMVALSCLTRISSAPTIARATTHLVLPHFSKRQIRASDLWWSQSCSGFGGRAAIQPAYAIGHFLGAPDRNTTAGGMSRGVRVCQNGQADAVHGMPSLLSQPEWPRG